MEIVIFRCNIRNGACFLVRRSIWLCLVCFLLSASVFPAGASASDGRSYVFQIELPAENGAALSRAALSRAEPVSRAAGIYRTSDYGVIRRCAAEGTLVAWAEDTEVTLFDPEEAMETPEEAAETPEEAESWSRAMLGADYAAACGLTGAGIRVAMIDSGIRPDFAELTGASVAEGVNFLVPEDSVERRNTADGIGHGTFVASIIASGAAGLAPGAELVPLKCFDSQNSSISCIIAAIYAAVDEFECRIINLSLGTSSDNPLLREAVSYAYEKGAILIAASGNLRNGRVSTGDDPVYYPAAYGEVVSVGAVDCAKQIAAFSVQNAAVWIAAPGMNVPGLSRTGTEYKTESGTSYAAPAVAAAAALALEADPGLDPAGFQALLQSSAEDAGAEGFDNAYGHGILNLGLLLAQVRSDGGSLILSRCGETACLSAFQPDPGVPYVLMLALYAEGGRQVGFSVLNAGEGGFSLNNLALPEEAETATLFMVSPETFLPLTEERKNS